MQNIVRFQGLVAANMKMTVLWDVLSIILIEIDRYFRVAYSLHIHGDCDVATLSLTVFNR
jgi:hypothetical protein